MNVQWKETSIGVLALVEAGTRQVLGTIVPYCGKMDTAYNYGVFLRKERGVLAGDEWAEQRLSKEVYDTWDDHDYEMLEDEWREKALELAKGQLLSKVEALYGRVVVKGTLP